jgi:SAM-dependent methyltransferase
VSSKRKTHGVYYTPEPVVRYLVQRTLAPLLDQSPDRNSRPLRVLDPACGAGVFLAEAHRYLQQHDAKNGLSATASLTRQIFGIDIDAEALRAARGRLAELALNRDRPHFPRQLTALLKHLERNLPWGDALLEADAPRQDASAGPPARNWTRTFPEVFQGANPGFDAVIGNPPYVNMRILSRTRAPELKQYLARRYQCAVGAYDLYVLFLERSFELLRAGGRCGMIVPNKIAAAEYADRCRKLLLERSSLIEIVDVADLRLFADAAVYPYLVIWEKQPASSRHRVALVQARLAGDRIRATQKRTVPQHRLSNTGRLSVSRTLAVEARSTTVPLTQCGEIHSGTTGFNARKLADCLRERTAARGQAVLDFIVSGNIDRYRIHKGAVRFMSQLWNRPVLRADCPLLSPRKRTLFAGPKIVVSGMSRRLEAAWDETGLALGVQVFAVADAEDPWYLLGLLNSRLLTYLFRTRFDARRLGGGFLSIHKGQLALLPIRVNNPYRADVARTQRNIARLAERQTSLANENSPRSSTRRAAADRELDEHVYRLYELKDREVTQVEQQIAAEE